MELSPHDFTGPFGVLWGDDPLVRSRLFSLFNPGFRKFDAPLPIIQSAVDAALARVANFEDTTDDERQLFKRFLVIADTAPRDIQDYVEFVLRRRTLPSDERQRTALEHRRFWETRKMERKRGQEGRTTGVSV
jgi:hypothetical protein